MEMYENFLGRPVLREDKEISKCQGNSAVRCRERVTSQFEMTGRELSE